MHIHFQLRNSPVSSLCFSAFLSLVRSDLPSKSHRLCCLQYRFSYSSLNQVLTAQTEKV